MKATAASPSVREDRSGRPWMVRIPGLLWNQIGIVACMVAEIDILGTAVRCRQVAARLVVTLQPWSSRRRFRNFRRGRLDDGVDWRGTLNRQCADGDGRGRPAGFADRSAAQLGVVWCGNLAGAQAVVLAIYMSVSVAGGWRYGAQVHRRQGSTSRVRPVRARSPLQCARPPRRMVDDRRAHCGGQNTSKRLAGYDIRDVRARNLGRKQVPAAAGPLRRCANIHQRHCPRTFCHLIRQHRPRCRWRGAESRVGV